MFEALINPFVLAGGFVAILLVLKTLANISNQSKLPLPPGPKGYPIIGNLFDMPSRRDKPWLVYDKWFKQYNSDILYFKVLGTSFVVLGSPQRTNDIFEKRSSNYSDRMRFPMLIDLMGMNYNMGLLPYGEWWRRHRRAFHVHFRVNAVSAYQPILLTEARELLRRALDAPENIFHHARQMFATTIMRITYGIDVQGAEDPYIVISTKVLAGFSEAGIPGRFLVDLIPILKYVPSWIPGAEFKSMAAEWNVINDEFANKPFSAVQDSLKKGTAVPSVATALIEGLPEKGHPGRIEEEIIARNTTAVAFVGGADTTLSAVQIFFLAMALNPSVQRKAQAEIDEVVGNGRLPNFSDRTYLPYVNALVKETMRWQPVAPLGFPHKSSEDDEYDGYFIPKGTLVFGNAWSILHDPQVFESPEQYMPERYLKNGYLDPNARNPDCAAFGYGRRICPGRHLSDHSLYATVSSVLAVYDIEPPVDGDGNFIQLNAEMTTGLLSYPTPFKCNIKPRSAAAEALIKEISP